MIGFRSFMHFLAGTPQKWCCVFLCVFIRKFFSQFALLLVVLTLIICLNWYLLGVSTVMNFFSFVISKAFWECKYLCFPTNFYSFIFFYHWLVFLTWVNYYYKYCKISFRTLFVYRCSAFCISSLYSSLHRKLNLKKR